jgi:hypothetical protein
MPARAASFPLFFSELVHAECVTSDGAFSSNVVMNAKAPSAAASCRGGLALVLVMLSPLACSNAVPGGGVGGSSTAASASGSSGSSGASSSAGTGGSSSGGAVGNGGGGSPTGGAAGAAGASGGASGMAGAGGAPIACQPPLPVTGTAVTINVDLALVKATVQPEVMSVHRLAFYPLSGSLGDLARAAAR